MSNPYTAPLVTPELAAEERQRPKFSRGLLMAYAVHHLFAVLGILAGVLVRPSVVRTFLPLHNPVASLVSVLQIPLHDLVIVLGPIVLTVFREPATFWDWLRMPVTLLIPLAGFMYAWSRRRDWLWGIAIASFLVFLSLVLSYSHPRTLEP